MARDYSAQLARELKVKIGHILETTASEWVNEKSENQRTKAQACVKKFMESEKRIWNALGEGLYTENERNGKKVIRKNRRGWSKSVSLNGRRRIFNSNLHKFKNRTKEMKNYTGYIILFDGIVISGRNRLLGNGAERRWTTSVKNGNGYALPLANVAKGFGVSTRGKIEKGFRGKNIDNTKTINISIAIFADSEHAFYVDNPNPKKRDAYTQGTGWFRIYSQELAELWMREVIEPMLEIVEEMKERKTSQSNFAYANSVSKKSHFDISQGWITDAPHTGKAWKSTFISSAYGKTSYGKYFKRDYAILHAQKGKIEMKIPIILTSRINKRGINK